MLVVEDDALVGLYLEDLLDSWGCEVVGPVASASEAEAAAAAGQFKFALLDVNLIGGTSFAAAEILSSKHVPFAFVTAYGLASVRQDLGAAAILSKPIVVAELKRVLGEAGVF
ncbi:MAG TPA: response regulator [Caulobacteraceae bacterium]